MHFLDNCYDIFVWFFFLPKTLSVFHMKAISRLNDFTLGDFLSSKLHS